MSQGHHRHVTSPQRIVSLLGWCRLCVLEPQDICRLVTDNMSMAAPHLCCPQPEMQHVAVHAWLEHGRLVPAKPPFSGRQEACAGVLGAGIQHELLASQKMGQHGSHPCRAFKALAFKRYQHVPIYLEWAPKDIFRPDAPKPAILGLHTSGATSAGGSAQPSEAAVVAQLTPDAEDADTSTIFVKNLAFSTGAQLQGSLACSARQIALTPPPSGCAASCSMKHWDEQYSIISWTVQFVGRRCMQPLLCGCLSAHCTSAPFLKRLAFSPVVYLLHLHLAVHESLFISLAVGVQLHIVARSRNTQELQPMLHAAALCLLGTCRDSIDKCSCFDLGASVDVTA